MCRVSACGGHCCLFLLHVCVPSDLLMSSCSDEHCCDVLPKKEEDVGDRFSCLTRALVCRTDGRGRFLCPPLTMHVWPLLCPPGKLGFGVCLFLGWPIVAWGPWRPLALLLRPGLSSAMTLGPQMTQCHSQFLVIRTQRTASLSRMCCPAAAWPTSAAVFLCLLGPARRVT